MSSASQTLNEVESAVNAEFSGGNNSNGTKSKSAFKLPGLKKLTSAAAGLQQLSNTFSSVSSRNQNESSVEETGGDDDDVINVKSSSKLSSSMGIPSSLNLFSKSKKSLLPGLFCISPFTCLVRQKKNYEIITKKIQENRLLLQVRQL